MRGEVRAIAGIAQSAGRDIGCDGIATGVAALESHPREKNEVRQPSGFNALWRNRVRASVRRRDALLTSQMLFSAAVQFRL